MIASRSSSVQRCQESSLAAGEDDNGLILQQTISLQYSDRGVATGCILVFIPPKSAQVNFLWGKNDVRTAIQQFYTPPKKNFYTPPPKNKFLATPQYSDSQQRQHPVAHLGYTALRSFNEQKSRTFPGPHE